MKPAIILGTHTMGLGVIRALGIQGVPVVGVYYNDSDMGYVSKYVLEAARVPHPELEPELFIEALLELGRRFPGSPLMPVSDESLKTVSKHKKQLEQYYRVACPDWEIVRLFIEKNQTYSLAVSAGVPVPKTLTPRCGDEVANFGRYVEYPCLVKPIESHTYYALFRKKLVQVNNITQLLAAYEEATNAGFAVMVQELIPGEDSRGANYNSYFWDGQPLAEFTAQKIRGAPAVFGSPCVAKSSDIPKVLDSGRKILRAIGFYGYSCTEFKHDPRDNVYKLMEVNGRHNLSTLLAVRCGINFPWMHYLHLTEESIPKQTTFEKNVYWIDMERDLAHMPKRIVKGKDGLLQILQPYLSTHIQAVFDIKDLKPFLKRYFDFITRAFTPSQRRNKRLRENTL